MIQWVVIQPKKGRFAVALQEGPHHIVIVESGSADGCFAARDYMEKADGKAAGLAISGLPVVGQPARKPRARKAKAEDEAAAAPRKSKYTPEQVAEVVDYFQKLGGPSKRGALKVTAEKHGVSASAVSKWYAADQKRLDEVSDAA